MEAPLRGPGSAGGGAAAIFRRRDTARHLAPPPLTDSRASQPRGRPCGHAPPRGGLASGARSRKRGAAQGLWRRQVQRAGPVHPHGLPAPPSRRDPLRPEWGSGISSRGRPRGARLGIAASGRAACAVAPLAVCVRGQAGLPAGGAVAERPLCSDRPARAEEQPSCHASTPGLWGSSPGTHGAAGGAPGGLRAVPGCWSGRPKISGAAALVAIKTSPML